MKIRLKNTVKVLFTPTFWILLSLISFSFADDAPRIQNTDPLGEIASQNNPKEEKEVIADSSIEQAVLKSSDLEPSDVVQSSFEEPVSLHEQQENRDSFSQPQHSLTDGLSHNSGILNEITDFGHEVVVTLVDTATVELQQRVELSSQQQHAETPTFAKNSSTSDKSELQETVTPQENATQDNDTRHSDVHDESNKSDDFTIPQQTEKILEVPKIMEPKQNLTEEIPSFSEWSQIQMEERKLREANSTTKNSKIRVRNKNYASPDCGAKIVAANSESVSAHSVLTPSRDEYKLNTCTTPKIWFIVELCEAIQAKKIEMANFELFSSSPKDFTVSVSDRFPTREWSNVGQFIAKDERVTQSYELHPHLFGKYIKVELHSHYGTEHFCPVSIFKVYGTSEFEVLEKEDQPHTNNPEDDDDDETLDTERGDNAQNLFSSAKDAVISIVKKAAEVLGKGNQSNQTSADQPNQMTYSPLISTCTTPSHLVVCTNCSDLLFGRVYELLSCRARQLNNLLSIEPIKNAIYNTKLCAPFGLDFTATSSTGDDENMPPAIIGAYVKSFFPPRYVGALCNTVAIIENKVVHNVSNNTSFKEINDSAKIESDSTPITITDYVAVTTTEELPTKTDMSSINSAIPVSDVSDLTQINPTKTLTPADTTNDNQQHELPPPPEDATSFTQTPTQDAVQVALASNETQFEHDVVAATISSSTQETIDAPVVASGEMNEDEATTSHDSVTTTAETLDLENIISDLAADPHININSALPPQPQIKESVFLRLSNRIKALERNMSLSGQYLEELSRRYKKQVEEMQRLLERTIATLNDESKRKDAANQRLEEKLNHLNEIVTALVADKNNAGDYFTPIFFALLVAVFVLFKCVRRSKHEQITSEVQQPQPRRKSIDVINHATPVKKERRPSEEIVKIAGTYEHLLVEGNTDWGKQRKQKRKKKKLLRLSQENINIASKSTSDIINKIVRPSMTSSRIWNRQESQQYDTVEWDGLSNGHHDIEDIPFVLEECDNSPLQDMPLPKPLLEETTPTTHHAPPSKVKLFPVRKISSPAYLKSQSHDAAGSGGSAATGNDSPQSLPDDLPPPKPVNGHKKTPSLDSATMRRKDNRWSPAPSTDGNASLDTDIDESRPTSVTHPAHSEPVGNGDSVLNGRAPKKDKKGTFKKIFRKVF